MPLSPGVSLVHALSYLFLRQHPLGMDIAGRVTAFFGGVIIYVMLYLTVSQMLNPLWGAVAIGLGLLYLPLYTLDGNSSDLLYAVMMSVLLWLLVKLDRNKNWPFLPLGLSFAVALTTLMRNDGFVVFVGLTPIVWMYLRGIYKPFTRLLLQFAVRWLVPFVCLIAVTVLLSGRTGGAFEVLPGDRTYIAFEQGAGLVRRFDLAKEGKNPWIEETKIAAAVYGSREENRSSVFRAYIRHPRAWVRRVGWNIRDFFIRWFEAHNGHLSAAPLLLFWFGWMDLFARRRFFLATSIGALLLPTGAYFLLTFWRGGYVVMYSPLILFMSVYALASLFDRSAPYSRSVRIFLGGGAAILGVCLIWIVALYSDYAYGYEGLIEGGISLDEILAAIVVWAAFIILPLEKPSREIWVIASVALIVGIWMANSGDILSLAFSDKAQAKRESREEAQEVLRNYIQFAFENLPGKRVCTEDPSLPWYARQQPIVLYELFNQEVRSSLTTLLRLLEERGCEYLLWREGNAPNLDGVLEPVFSENGMTLLRFVGPEVEGQEIILEEFDEISVDRWSAFGSNNVEGDFTVSNGILTLAYDNDLSKRDIYAYIFAPTESIAGVVAVKMRVRIKPGTRLTVDVVKDGSLVSPRYLNYYTGTGEWEEVVIPVGGRLDSLTIGIGEMSEADDTPNYRLELDWIKALVRR